MDSTYTPPVNPEPVNLEPVGAPSLEDAFERALHELARAGIDFEIVSEVGAWERAA